MIKLPQFQQTAPPKWQERHAIQKDYFLLIPCKVRRGLRARKKFGTREIEWRDA